MNTPTPTSSTSEERAEETDPRPPLMLPAEIVVVGQRFHVEVVDDYHRGLARMTGGANAIGATELQRGRMAIRGGGEQSEDQVRDTLLHEVMHAIDYLANGGLDNQLDEEVIARMSTALLDTLRRNPGLVAALISR